MLNGVKWGCKYVGKQMILANSDMDIKTKKKRG